MFWSKQRSGSSPSRLYCSSLFCECPKFCDLAKQRRKIFGGFSEAGKDDFSLYFCWRCVVFLVLYYSSAAIARHCPCTLSMVSLSTVTVHGTLYSGTVRCHCTLHTATAHCHYTLSLYIVTVHCTLHSVHCTPQGFIECIPTHSMSATAQVCILALYTVTLHALYALTIHCHCTLSLYTVTVHLMRSFLAGGGW